MNDHGLHEYRHRQTGIVMVRVPGGTFTMGTSQEEAGERRRQFDGHLSLRALDAELPQHEVTLSPFLIPKYETTQAEWQEVMAARPSYFKGDSLPVEQVSWEDCKEFSKKTGLSLPTEAQWEHACRAGSKGPFAGTGNLDDMGWYGDNSGATHPVGRKQPNDFGLHDMHGNVWELCEDAFDGEFYSRLETVVGPGPTPFSGSRHRVVRGGSWDASAEDCRSAVRGRRATSDGGHNVGLRGAYFPLPRGL